MVLAVATIVQIVLYVCLVCAVLLAIDVARHQVDRMLRAAERLLEHLLERGEQAWKLVGAHAANAFHHGSAPPPRWPSGISQR